MGMYQRIAWPCADTRKNEPLAILDQESMLVQVVA